MASRSPWEESALWRAPSRSEVVLIFSDSPAILVSFLRRAFAAERRCSESISRWAPLHRALVTLGRRALVTPKDQSSSRSLITSRYWIDVTLVLAVRAEINVPNPDGAIRPGMYATATIKLAERPHDVDVNKIVRRPFELGLRSGNEIAIQSGIDENQLIVLKQPEPLKPRQTVGVAPPAK